MNKQKFVIAPAILAVFIIGCLIGATIAQSGAITITPESFSGDYSYLIETDGTYVWAKDGRTGQVVFGGANNAGGVSGTNASAVIQSAINALPAITYVELGESVSAVTGKIILKEGTYYVNNLTIPSGSIITIEGTDPFARVADASHPLKGGTVLYYNGGAGGSIINVPRAPYSYCHSKVSLSKLSLAWNLPVGGRAINWTGAFQGSIEKVNLLGAGTATAIYMGSEPYSGETSVKEVSIKGFTHGLYLGQEHVSLFHGTIRNCQYGIYVGAQGAFKRGGIYDYQLFNNAYDLYCAGTGAPIFISAVLLEHSGVPSSPVVVTNGRKLTIGQVMFTPSTTTLSQLFANLSDITFLSNIIACHNPVTYYRIENTGTATILAGQTSVTVNHSLAGTPTIISVTPRGNIGAVWISARNATSFTITCGTAPSSDTIVDWYAKYKP